VVEEGDAVGAGRRLQDSDSPNSSEIDNPVICINKGETIIFSIPNDENYPVYLKDSLVNTNNGFDYGAFDELEREIDSGTTTISTFAFTFIDDGIYDFADNADKDRHMIIAVMGGSE
jgi:hypothetical protein